MRSFRKQRESYILARAASAHTLMHVGCTGAPETEWRWDKGILLHKALCDQAQRLQHRVVGIDIDRPSLAWLRRRMPQSEMHYADAHQLEQALPGERFELILAGDVIEHLPNPGLFLQSCRRALAPRGELLLTTANAYGVARFVKALVGHEAVHPEHTAYFSFATLRRLCEMCGFACVRTGYYACEPHLARMGWKGWLSVAIENVCCRLWPQLSEGIILEARLADEPAPDGGGAR